MMIIKETYVFTKIIKDLMTDEVYSELQTALVQVPDLGDLIPGSGGLRKVRWHLPGKGKRGGVRVIYYWLMKDDQIYMLYAYRKNQCADLTKAQLRQLKAVVAEELGDE